MIPEKPQPRPWQPGRSEIEAAATGSIHASITNQRSRSEPATYLEGRFGCCGAEVYSDGERYLGFDHRPGCRWAR